MAEELSCLAFAQQSILCPFKALQSNEMGVPFVLFPHLTDAAQSLRELGVRGGFNNRFLELENTPKP